MRRTATYINRNKCDWCGCDLPPGRPRFKFTGRAGTAGAQVRLTDNPYWLPGVVKFVSPIDGNLVRARLCPDHLERFAALCESG